MPSKDFSWSKTRAQCPYCGGWFTRQGILGHIRFRHPDKKKDADKATLNIDWVTVYIKAAEMYMRDGRLTAEVRDRLLDSFLIDYLERRASGKT
ncbi:MAG: hypothetical protein ABSA18_15260 [Dehalococcoidia bacterium]